ncbi:MAG: peptide-methionine (S)-S-oxide reductase MsrA [Chloroflexi bacterium]|nr:peptide-methionine (S)-S-oxide reductase MsrA [Chloroflexota bacterium]
MSGPNLETATLASGCFWCTEAVFQQVQGVKSVMSGYTGGRLPNPSYIQVCSGATGHAEAVQVAYDPSVISYREVLEIFFATHDPTTMDRQGADVGTQYRSAIFYHDDAQKKTAEEVMEDLRRQKIFRNPIVTKLEPAGQFYPSEEYHRDYYQRNSDAPYCQFVIEPKVAKFRKQFAKKLASPVAGTGH